MATQLTTYPCHTSRAIYMGFLKKYNSLSKQNKFSPTLNRHFTDTFNLRVDKDKLEFILLVIQIHDKHLYVGFQKAYDKTKNKRKLEKLICNPKS